MEKLRNINHFWDRWRKEYLINLRECQKILMEDDNRQVISVGDVVMTEEDKVSRFCWRMGLVEKLIYGKDGVEKGAVVRVSKTRREISRPINKLYLTESIETKKRKLMMSVKLL